MPSLDLGVLVGRAVLDTREFDAPYDRTVGKMRALSGEAGKAAAGVGKLDESLAASAGSADKAAAAAGKATQSATRMSAADERAAATAKARADAMARVGAVMAELTGESAKVQQATLRQLAANQRLAASENEAGSAAARQATETARLASAQASAIGASSSLAAAQAKQTGMWARYGSGLMRTAGELGIIVGAFAAVKGVIDITKQAAAYQRQMVQIRTLTGASVAEIKNMSSALLGLAGKVAESPTDLATSLYHMESVGLSGAKALQAVTVAAKGAQIGNADLEDTTNALTSTIASGIIKSQSYAGAMSDLLTIVGSGDMTLQQFNEVLGTGVLATLAGYGLSLKDVGAAIALFGDNNIRGAKAATTLRMAVQGLAAPMKAGAGTLEQLGLTTSSLADDMEKGGLKAAIGDLSNRLKKAGYTAKETGQVLTDAFGKRAGTGINILVREFDTGTTTLLKKYADLEHASMTFGQRWTAVTQTASFQFRQLGASAEAAGISFAEKALPALGALASVLTGAVRGAISVVSDALHPFIAAWHTVSDIVSPVVHAMSGMGSTLSPLVHILEGVGGAVLSMWIAFKGYTIAVAVIRGISDLFGALVAKATAARIAAQEAGAGIAAGGAEARAGWAGILGPLALVSIGVMTLVSAFHHSSAASKEAADAAKAYTDALSGDGGPGAVMDTIVKQLDSNGVFDTINKLNSVLGHTVVTGTEFINAIEHGDPTLKQLQTRLQGIIDRGKQVAQTSRVAAAESLNMSAKQAAATQKQRATEVEAAQAASKALADLNAQYSGMSQAQAKELALWKEAGQKVTPITQKFAATLHVSTDAAKQYAGMMGYAVTQQGNILGATKDTSAAISGLREVYSRATAAGRALLDQWKNFAGTAGTAADRAALIGATLKAANGDALGFAGSMNSAATAAKALRTDLRQTASGIGKNGESTKAFLASIVNLKTGTIQYRKAAAQPLIGDMQSMQDAAMNAAQAMYQHARATMSGKQAADAAYRVYKAQTSGALVDEATKLGLTAGQAHKLAQQYFGMPKHVKTLIEQEGADPVVTILNKIGRLLADLVGKPWNMKVGADNRDAMSKAQQVQSKMNILKGMHVEPTVGLATGSILAQIAYVQDQLNKIQGPTVMVHVMTPSGALSQGRAVLTPAGGGFISQGPGTETSDSIPAMVSKHEFVVRASQAKKHLGLLHAINRGVAGYAQGGPVGGDPAITKTQDHGKTVWIYAGHRYDSIQAAENAQASAEKQNKKSALSNAQSAVRMNVSLSSEGVRRFLKDLDKARGAIQKAVDAGVSTKALDKLDVHLAKMIARARKQFAHLRLHINKQDLRALDHSMDSVSSMRSAMKGLIGDMKNLGAPDSSIARLRDQMKQLGDDIRQRDADVKQLHTDLGKLSKVQSALNAEKSSIRSAVGGVFDITTAGQGPNGGPVSLGAMRAQETQAKLMLTKYDAAINVLLHRYGKSKAGSAWIRQLAEAGLSDYGEVMALAHGRPSFVRSMIATQADINQMSGGLAQRIGMHDHGAALRDAQHAVNVDRRAVERDRRLLDKLEAHVERATEHGTEKAFRHFRIELNGREVGRGATTGQNQNKHLSPRSGRRG